MTETMASYASKGELTSLDGDSDRAATRKIGVMQYVTEVLCQSFSLLENCAQRAMRENGGTGDLADIILEEEDLPLGSKKKAGSFIDQLF